VVNADDKLKMLNCQNILSFLLFSSFFIVGEVILSLSLFRQTHTHTFHVVNVHS